MKKKILTILLCFCMCLSLSPAAYAAGLSGFGDKDSVAYVNSVDAIIQAGIVEGMDNGKIDPKGSFTREQAAKLVAYAHLGKDAADKLTAGAAPFMDVDADRWSAGYISYCASIGILSGMGDGSFAPEYNVTGMQLAKMMLCALGYGKDGEFDGVEWEINTTAAAGKIGLLIGFEGTATEAERTAISDEIKSGKDLRVWTGVNDNSYTVNAAGDALLKKALTREESFNLLATGITGAAMVEAVNNTASRYSALKSVDGGAATIGKSVFNLSSEYATLSDNTKAFIFRINDKIITPNAVLKPVEEEKPQTTLDIDDLADIAYLDGVTKEDGEYLCTLINYKGKSSVEKYSKNYASLVGNFVLVDTKTLEKIDTLTENCTPLYIDDCDVIGANKDLSLVDDSVIVVRENGKFKHTEAEDASLGFYDCDISYVNGKSGDTLFLFVEAGITSVGYDTKSTPIFICTNRTDSYGAIDNYGEFEAYTVAHGISAGTDGNLYFSSDPEVAKMMKDLVGSDGYSCGLYNLTVEKGLIREFADVSANYICAHGAKCENETLTLTNGDYGEATYDIYDLDAKAYIMTVSSGGVDCEETTVEALDIDDSETTFVFAAMGSGGEYEGKVLNVYVVIDEEELVEQSNFRTDEK